MYSVDEYTKQIFSNSSQFFVRLALTARKGSAAHKAGPALAVHSWHPDRSGSLRLQTHSASRCPTEHSSGNQQSASRASCLQQRRSLSCQACPRETQKRSGGREREKGEKISQPWMMEKKRRRGDSLRSLIHGTRDRSLTCKKDIRNIMKSSLQRTIRPPPLSPLINSLRSPSLHSAL
jgi:hypothetical protein